MLLAKLICSDEECPSSFEVYGEPEELDRLACECGCTLQAIAFSRATFVEPTIRQVEFRLPAAA